MCRVMFNIGGNANANAILGGGGVGGGGVNPLVFNSRETLQGIVGIIFILTHKCCGGPVRGQKILTLVFQSPTKNELF